MQEGRTIAQREAVLRLPGGDSKFVIVARQPIEIDEENCMLFTFIDLGAGKKAELSLGQSEERFSKAFRLAPVPMAVCALPELRFIEINAAFAAATGYPAAEILGQPAADIGLWKDARTYRELQTRLDARQDVRNFEISLSAYEGAVIDCLFSAEAVLIQGEICMFGVIQDITEYKRSEIDLIAAIDAMMKGPSWFSRTVMEKLAQIRQPHDGARYKVSWTS